MPYFEVLENYSKNSDILVYTTHNSWLFDCDATVYGKNVRLPSFSDPPKPLKFILRKYIALDSVFISHSESIGVLFLKNTKIYLTRPVYEQILLRYEKYKEMSISYDEIDKEELYNIYKCKNKDKLTYITNNKEDNYKIIDINKINLSHFKRNVIFIKYNQIVQSEGYSVQSKPCGTFMGWCYYNIVCPSNTIISIVTSYSAKRRFSTEAVPIKSDFLILNRKIKNLKFENIEKLTKLFERVPQSLFPLLIPVDFETFFIEVLFHCLSILDNSKTPITIYSSIFNKIDVLLNVQSEWLNKDYFTISEPFPVRKYSHFNVVNSLHLVNDSKNIVFCSFECYDLIKDKIRNKFEVVLINSDIKRLNTLEEEGTNTLSTSNHNDSYSNNNSFDSKSIIKFNIKIESLDEEILSTYQGTVVTQFPFFIAGDSNFDFVYVNKNTTVLDNKILVSGILTNSDFNNPFKIEKTLADEKFELKKMVEEETPIFYDGWYYLVKQKVKFRCVLDVLEVEEL